MFDAELYRDKAEVEAWKTRGPLVQFKDWALERGVLANTDFEALEREAEAVIAKAVAFAENASWEPVADLTKDVMTPRPAAGSAAEARR
jgi:TPP-dependent pyruvate/acetoin dehydrogenase alpha subunit